MKMLELLSSIVNGTNNTTFSQPPISAASLPVWYISLCFLISFLCILGNGCIIYLVKTRPSLQDISNTFIVSLAFADLLVGVIVFPSKLACTLLPADVLLQRVFSEMFMYWSVYNLCGMTIERFVFIVLPMKHHIYMSKRNCIVLITICWLIPLVNFLLHFTWLYSKSEETKKFWLKNFTAIETIMMVGVPSLVLVALYLKIFTVAQRHRKITANQIGMVSYNTNLSSAEQTENNVLTQKYQDVVLSENSYKEKPSGTRFDMLSYDNTSNPVEASVINQKYQNPSSSKLCKEYVPERKTGSPNNQSSIGPAASSADSFLRDQNYLGEVHVSSVDSYKENAFGTISTNKPPNSSPIGPCHGEDVDLNDKEVSILDQDVELYQQNKIELVSLEKSSASGSAMSEVHGVCGNEELDPRASGYKDIKDNKDHIKDLYVKSSDILNHLNDKEKCNNFDNSDTTPGDSANIVKCQANEKLSCKEDELAKNDEVKQTDCRVLSNANRNISERIQKPNKIVTKCQVNSFNKAECIDQGSQIVDFIEDDNPNESDNTVDGFLKSQSIRVYNLSATFMNSFSVNNNQNGVESVAKSSGQIAFPVLNSVKITPNRAAEQRTLVYSNDEKSIEKQLEEENNSKRGANKTRKSPIIDSKENSDQRYLAFYSELQRNPIKATKQSMKKRLGKIIQKKRRSGASVIGLVIAAFLICWGVSLYRSICYYFELCNVSEGLTQAQWILLLLNSAVNPIVYAMLKTDLRKEFVNIKRFR